MIYSKLQLGGSKAALQIWIILIWEAMFFLEQQAVLNGPVLV
jgi:hypothetical protein